MIEADQIFEFGRFRLDAGMRSLHAGNAPVQISSRAFDILQVLIEHRDRVVTKNEIIDRVWQGTFVDENNLAVQVSALRRALAAGEGGPQFIVTVPGRGYRFVGPVTKPEPAKPPVEPETETTAAASEPAERAPPGSANARRWPMRAALAAIVLLALGLGAGLWTGRIGPAGTATVTETRHVAEGPPPRLSIVVLPFRNLGDDPQNNYLADAISDDLTTDLSHIPGSFVIARASADIYKDHAAAADQIGRELGVRYLLEGSLRQEGENLAINAQLIDAGTGAHLWAERFDASRRQLAETQTTIVRHIASALNFTLVQIEGKRSLKDRPDNPDALDLFLRARSTIERDDSFKGLGEAQPLLERAIALQPDFADAMGELAWLLLRKAKDFDDPSDEDDMAAARKLISRALGLAPQNARALAARGFLLTLDGHCHEATASYQMALSFNPNDIDARTGLALCAVRLGRPDEAAALIKEVLLIDPEDPENRVRYNQLGLVELVRGKSEDAIEWFEKATAGDPDPVAPDESLSRREWNEIGLIAAYSTTGRLQQARARYEKYVRLWPHRTVWRLASYFTKAESVQPGLKAALDGLKAAGMPEFADERLDEGVAASPMPRTAGDFELTANAVPGARTITTSALMKLTHGDPSPIILDVGCGAGVPDGASWIVATFPSDEGQKLLRSEIARSAGESASRPIVVMGSSVYDWNAYNATLAVISLGYRNVSWYRGGEEAWAAAGLKAHDRRDP